MAASCISPELVKGREQVSDSNSQEHVRHPLLAATPLKT